MARKANKANKASKPAAKQTVEKQKKSKQEPDVAANIQAIKHSGQSGMTGYFDIGMSAAVKAAQEYYAKNRASGSSPLRVYGAHDQLARTLCIPMPALAPRFLVQLEGWPLTRFVLVDGYKESCKSAFLAEVGTWHRRQGGLCGFIETEAKDAAGLRDSFFNYDREAWKFIPCNSQDEWNHAYFWFVNEMKKLMDGYETTVEKNGKNKREKIPGVGRVAPIFIGVDSISAVLIEKFREAMLEDGSPSMNHPQGARLLSDFFKVGPKEIVDYPFTFMAVSHLREQAKNPNMPHIKTRVTTGGEAPKYQMSMEIEMQRRGHKQYVRSHDKYGDISAIDLQMHIRKNSLAPHEWINVEMVWYFDPDDIDPIKKQPRQKSYFDWHSSSIELLLDCMKASQGNNEFSSRRAKQLRALIDLSPDSDNRYVSSKFLGISENDKLSYFEAGLVLEERIQSDDAFRLELYTIMGIQQQFMFQIGKDMLLQFAENSAAMRACETQIKLDIKSAVPLPAGVTVKEAPEQAIKETSISSETPEKSSQPSSEAPILPEELRVNPFQQSV